MGAVVADVKRLTLSPRWRLWLVLMSLCRLGQVVAQGVGAGGVAQLGQGGGFDLSDAFSGDSIDPGDVIDGAGLAVGEAEPEPDNAGLAFGQGGQHRVQLVLEQGEADGVGGDHGLGVFDEVAEWVVALVAEGLVQRDRFAGMVLQLPHRCRGEVHLVGQFLRGGLAPEPVAQVALDATQFVDHLDQVYRDADGAGLAS